MSIVESSEPNPGGLLPSARPEPLIRRPFHKRAMHAVRRAHLYFGLFLLPWAVLYGTTGFLFNHPTAFADAPTVSFGKSELAGTPMESPPPPDVVAAEVVAALNDRAKGGKPYTLVAPEKARYTREFAFVTVKTDGQDVSILFDVKSPGGTVRSKSAPPAVEAAPFEITPHMQTPAPADLLRLPNPLHERVKAAVPVVLERTGFPTGPVTVTSVPDLSFLMSDGTKTWNVTYNSLAETVTGSPADSAPPPEELTTRRFLTHMHLSSGFPGRADARWFWAVFVDAMAFVMVFWGVSGLFMWWQVKSTRKWGVLVLLVSALAATALGLGMHEVLAPR